MREFIVYKITHIPTEMVYIGRKTATLADFENYWGGSTHPLFASSTNSKVNKRYDTFIQDNLSDYKKEIIEICSNVQELGERETYWIRHFKDIVKTANKTDNYKWTTAGLTHKEMYGDKHEEIVENMRQARIDYNKSPEKRKQLSEKMSKNNPMSDKEAFDKVAQHNRERAQTPEAKARAKANLVKYNKSPENIERLRKHMKEKSKSGRNVAFEKACAGTKWVNKGSEQKRIKKELLQEYLDNGWKTGRLPKNKNTEEI